MEAEALDELEKLLEGDIDFEGDIDDYDPDADDDVESLEELEDIMDNKTLGADTDLDDDPDSKDAEDAEDERINLDLYIKMIQVKGGCFKMGDNFGDGHYDERPVHRVCIDDYAMSEAEITQAFWEKVTGMNPSKSKGPNKPVEFIGYVDAMAFIYMLNEKTGRHFRLPTEAEWEFAARNRGKLEKWSGTNDEDDLIDYAWFDFNAMNETQPVKTKKPNPLGFYDMNGNVWEWVYDYYDMGYYTNAPSDNPEGPDFAVWRALRGGSFIDDSSKLRNSGRYGSVFSRRTSNTGFRLAE
jgi:formylglycine-generating enzyme required for sulfatase activity